MVQSVHREVSFYIPGDLSQVCEKGRKSYEDPCHRSIFLHHGGTMKFWNPEFCGAVCGQDCELQFDNEFE